MRIAGDRDEFEALFARAFPNARSINHVFLWSFLCLDEESEALPGLAA